MPSSACGNSRASFAKNASEEADRRKRVIAMAAGSILAPIEQELFNVMALAIQGNFEKGFRRWLRNSLVSRRSDELSDADVVSANWKNPAYPKRDLGMIMKVVRGVHLADTQ